MRHAPFGLSVLIGLAFATLGWCDASDRLDSILAGIRSEREKLLKGEYVATIHASVTTPSEGKRTSHRKRICAFDIRQRLFRQDILQSPHPRGDARVLRTVFLLTPDLTAQYASTNHGRLLHITKKDGELQSPFMEYPFDLRALGVCVMSDVTSGGAFEEILTKFAKAGEPVRIEEQGGRATVTWHLKYEELIWVVQTENGFTPERIERRRRIDLEGDEFEQEPFQVQEIKWDRKEKVWVPVQYSVSYTRRVPQIVEGKEHFVDEYKQWNWNIDWKSVNGPLDEAGLFDYRGIDLPTGTTISDQRTGKARTVQHGSMNAREELLLTELQLVSSPLARVMIREEIVDVLQGLHSDLRRRHANGGTTIGRVLEVQERRLSAEKELQREKLKLNYSKSSDGTQSLEVFPCEIIDATTRKRIESPGLTVQFIFKKLASNGTKEEIISNLAWGPNSPAQIKFLIPEKVMNHPLRNELAVQWGASHPDYEPVSVKRVIQLGPILRDEPKDARDSLLRIELTRKR